MEHEKAGYWWLIAARPTRKARDSTEKLYAPQARLTPRAQPLLWTLLWWTLLWPQIKLSPEDKAKDRKIKARKATPPVALNACYC
jgi:hypothetical protein